jgi:hypothetical protein
MSRHLCDSAVLRRAMASAGVGTPSAGYPCGGAGGRQVEVASPVCVPIFGPNEVVLCGPSGHVVETTACHGRRQHDRRRVVLRGQVVGAEEWSHRAVLGLVFLRQGCFVRQSGRVERLADPGVAHRERPGDEQRASHLAEPGSEHRPRSEAQRPPKSRARSDHAGRSSPGPIG